MVNLYVLDPVVSNSTGHIDEVNQLIVKQQRQGAIFYQSNNGSSRKRLAYAGEPEERTGLHRSFNIGDPAIASCQNKLAISGNRQGGSRDGALFHKRFDC